MKKLTLFIYWLLALLCFSVSLSSVAGTLKSINISNNNKETRVDFRFSFPTKYSYFYLKKPNRLIIDFANSDSVRGILPRKNNTNLQSIEQAKAARPNNLRVVLHLEQTVRVIFMHNNNTVSVKIANPNGRNSSDKAVTAKNNDKNSNASNKQNRKEESINIAPPTTTPYRTSTYIVAIDPGHGGKDPGAIGKTLKIKEKNITLSIAKELKALLDRDPHFKAVLTRSGDYFISVPDRSDIARKYKANFLISIHADSAPSTSPKGASVWVLSNRRANNEMGKWLEDHEKQSELLGGAGNVLSTHNEKYLGQTVLDLQFGHSQRVGYELGDNILRRFGQIAQLSRKEPQHASLGVLRAPDIPSVLVETGFVSNKIEEQKLNTLSYRRQIARAIYLGLVDYRKNNLSNNHNIENTSPHTNSNKQQQNKNKDKNEKLPTFHTVRKDETLYQISRTYNISVNRLLKLNPKLNPDHLLVGQKVRLTEN
ncbi:N-acetylmuramoyl-l-alanine amidase II [Gallibacterium anatis]|nr:N-acetylmuramoyl-L-alanine amidase [Gallibacterium anatis]KGQ36055.1 N-acetylmuramoyl-l-alanine amidase II [Gallibacterium anatis]